MSPSPFVWDRRAGFQGQRLLRPVDRRDDRPREKRERHDEDDGNDDESCAQFHSHVQEQLCCPAQKKQSLQLSRNYCVRNSLASSFADTPCLRGSLPAIRFRIPSGGLSYQHVCDLVAKIIRQRQTRGLRSPEIENSVDKIKFLCECCDRRGWDALRDLVAGDTPTGRMQQRQDQRPRVDVEAKLPDAGAFELNGPYDQTRSEKNEEEKEKGDGEIRGVFVAPDAGVGAAPEIERVAHEETADRVLGIVFRFEEKA